ncbi:MAG: SPOR domain-containing protein [Gammaproteobacteria bacterium]|nr:SPOR domain-containing protein [Gammaproteobacteria bacterium]
MPPAYKIDYKFMSLPAVIKTQLNPLTLSALGLRQQPFSNVEHAVELYRDSALDLQFQALLQHLIYSEFLQIQIAPEGGGKSSLALRLLALDKKRHHVFLVRSSKKLDMDQIIRSMLLSITDAPPSSRAQGIKQLSQHIKDLESRSISAILLVDDAHKLSTATLNNLLQHIDLLNSRSNGYLRILLLAEISIENLLSQVHSQQIDEGRLYNSQIKLFSKHQQKNLIQHRLRRSGYQNEDFPLTETQLQMIHKQSQGNPLKVLELTAEQLNNLYTPKASLDRVKSWGLHNPFIAVPAITLIIASLTFAWLEPKVALWSEIQHNSALKQSLLLKPKMAEEPPPANDLEPAASPEEKILFSALSAPITAAPTTTEKIPPIESLALAVAPLEIVPLKTPTKVVPMKRVSKEVVSAEVATLETLPVKITSVDITPLKSTLVKKSLLETAPIKAALTETASILPLSNTIHNKVEPKNLTNSSKQLHNESWLLQQNPKHYTLQIMAMRNETAFLDEVQQLNLNKNQTAHYRSLKKGKTWYALTYGSFTSLTAAKHAINDLPVSLQQNRPWIRRLKAIQNMINNR